MKKETISVKLDRRKTRALELYSNNSPFKPRIVASKLQYKRKAKHPKQELSFD
jgi:hypothetical protein